ncbi:alpha-(1,3)-fucosyltransferase 7 isoform X1 [Poecilia formosa]|uniref:alpha-(1,3)-fucosyltransferase 7 isoform X2 n=1 Tax=Poecilia formosa TaxID=48698 RepID=UPI0004438E5B|nr:PREDICTED: alpha-(1,3)-fucosyltransferase 7-like isoform X2 [Poecilia formosa]XP_016534369.1 PREDICTED: alpha-(1,3)-fucosyltransferase 7-like isoform X1 [Poecilia formosa]
MQLKLCGVSQPTATKNWVWCRLHWSASYQGDPYTKKMKWCSMKRGLLFCILSGLLLCLHNGWREANTYNYWKSTANVTILVWKWPFGRSYSLKGNVCLDLYKIPNCTLVDQRSLFPSAHVVVFHNRELVQGSQQLPIELPRPQGQRWAWMSLESPAHNGNLKKFANIFNMTISYRRDADVTIPYGELLPLETESNLVEDSHINKTSLVCWVVSNYRNQHRRSQVYKELSATVPVKVYGRWNKMPLSSEDLLPTISRCYFYLAFENSLAKDYVTEKLWHNAYKGGAVPVVLGPPISDYKAVAPEHSFIHVDEFSSVRELGKYLQRLAEDRKRYEEYFNWKKHWKVKVHGDWRESLCKICLQYNSLPQHKVYSDLEAWDKKGYRP